MRISCPHCLEKTHTIPETATPDAAEAVKVQCLNPHCGWGGTLRVVIDTTSKQACSPR